MQLFTFISMCVINLGVLLYNLFIRIFAMHSWEIVALGTSGNRVRHIVSSQDDAVVGLVYWDADHDRARTRNTRHSNAQCTHIFY